MLKGYRQYDYSNALIHFLSQYSQKTRIVEFLSKIHLHLIVKETFLISESIL